MLPDQHRHAGRSFRVDAKVTRRLADHVDDGPAPLVGNEQAADAGRNLYHTPRPSRG